MWSGPRNISTAMMYSFGNRADCLAWDEPFYGFSLVHHGNDHPMRQEIIAANDTSWDSLVAKCTNPASKPLFYQKHMTHHMLPGFDRTWIKGLANAFLIRSPERVLASYARKWSDIDLRAIGFVEQAEIFGMVADAEGKAPPVIDAEDVLADPRKALTALCARLGISFDEAMLSWPVGPKPFDGVWAPHWYEAVWRSTGFRAQTIDPATLPAPLARIAEQATPYYQKLRAFRLS
ncbi:MAG: HAD family hydrolase [Rhizobiales bacterium]|nr:HAD family hydrolase [Hyphomicrobiales bacterium]